MTDLIFSNNSGTLRVVFRTDLLKGNYLLQGGGGFTVMTITGLDTPTLHAQKVLTAFHQLPYDLGSFINFANEYGLDLTAVASDGSSSTILVNLGSGS